MADIITGRNPVMEAIRGEREIEKLLIQKDSQGSIKKIIGMAKEKHIPIQYVEKTAFDRLAEGGVHQGVAAYLSIFEYCEIKDILQIAKDKGEDPFVVILDGIEDPHNLGAIIRTADGAGAHGVIIPKRRAVGITDTVVKASAGAVEHVSVAKVSNIVQTIASLKDAGLWIGACDMDGEVYTKANITGAFALVVGGEGQGVGRLIREKCDFILSIPMAGKVNSLNASNAAAVLMYEVKRQRSLV